MNWQTFRSSFLGGLFGLILGVLLGFITKALIFEVWNIQLTSVIVYCTTLICGVLSWFITYLLSLRKDTEKYLVDMIKEKLDEKVFISYKEQHQEEHEELRTLLESMDSNIKLILNKMMK